MPFPSRRETVLVRGGGGAESQNPVIPLLRSTKLWALEKSCGVLVIIPAWSYIFHLHFSKCSFHTLFWAIALAKAFSQSYCIQHTFPHPWQPGTDLACLPIQRWPAQCCILWLRKEEAVSTTTNWVKAVDDPPSHPSWPLCFVFHLFFTKYHVSYVPLQLMLRCNILSPETWSIKTDSTGEGELTASCSVEFKSALTCKLNLHLNDPHHFPVMSYSLEVVL